MADLCPTCKQEIPSFALLFGQLVRRELETRGITQREFGKMIGMDETQVARLVRGAGGDPKIATLRRIAKAFNVTLSQLLQGFN